MNAKFTFICCVLKHNMFRIEVAKDIIIHLNAPTRSNGFNSNTIYDYPVRLSLAVEI